MKNIVLTDFDGTLASFWYYFVPAMRTIIPKLATRLSEKSGRRVSLDEVSWEFGRVMRLFGTHEYPWTPECTKFWQDRDWKGLWSSYAEFCNNVSAPFWAALDFERQRSLRLYDDVRETLESLAARGVKIVVISDGPYYMVRAKVGQLEIDPLLDGVYALETHEPGPEYHLSDEELELGRSRVAQFSSVALRCPAKENAKTFEKPAPDALLRALRESNEDLSRAIMVGDSLPKDGGAAAALGMEFLWAAYGVMLPPEYHRMIETHFVPPDERKIAKVKVVPPMATPHGASSWKQVLDFTSGAPLPVLTASTRTSGSEE